MKSLATYSTRSPRCGTSHLTFRGSSSPAPTGSSPALVGPRGEYKLYQITEWHDDVNMDEGHEEYEKWFQDFKSRYPEIDWHYHRIYSQMYMLKDTIDQAGTTESDAVAKALEGMIFHSHSQSQSGQVITMRQGSPDPAAHVHLHHGRRCQVRCG